MRSAAITRKTKETEISVSVLLDGAGVADIETGVGFFDHMLDQVARHSLIDLTVRVEGRPAYRPAPHRRGCRHRARPGARQGARRQARRRALRRLPAADGRDVDPRRARPVGAPVSGVQRQLPQPRRSASSTPAGARVLPGAGASTPASTLHIETLYGANSHHIAEILLQGRRAGAWRGDCDRCAPGRAHSLDQGRAVKLLDWRRRGAGVG